MTDNPRPVAWLIVSKRDGAAVRGSRPYRSEKLAAMHLGRYGGDTWAEVIPVYRR